MKKLFRAVSRAFASVAQSEAGECLSVRRKAQLLRAEGYVGPDEAVRSLPQAVAPSRPSATVYYLPTARLASRH